MPETDPTNMEHEHWNTNSGNLIMQSPSVVDGVDDQGWSKVLRSSSSSSSSFDSQLEDDEQSFKMESSPAVGGVDVQVCRNTSRSSSSSSSSPVSRLDGNVWDENEQHKNQNGVNLMIQSSPTVHELVDHQDSSKMSRSSSSSSSSPEPSTESPFKEHDEKDWKTSTANLVMQSSLAVDQVDVQVSNKNLRSASSSYSFSSSCSPDSPRDDPFREDDQECRNSFQSNVSLPGQNNEGEIGNGKPKETAEVKNPSPDFESNLADMPATDSPPMQAMERPTNSKYRIPSHVFARTKSNNPVDWSVTSNESLFSIHMGNMSFTRDQLFLRPEELATIPGESSTSGQMFNYSTSALPGESTTTTPGQMFNYSTNQPPGSKAEDGKSHELAVETMKEVLKENDHQKPPGNNAAGGKSHESAVEKTKEVLKENEHQNREKSIAEGRISHHSAGSNASTMSFAFPILTDLERGHSVSIDGSSRLGRENQQIESQKLSTPKTPSQALEQPKLNDDPPAGTESRFGISWFSCMPCCTFCR
ncbi:hypothetical protein ACH5RR_009004 [Cinchona calisaya]|uniref:Uncharacterized protein n=1 Tax=Cinchona calisaya TaxID=153742 RepID=A0ABD3AGS5_9GENT